jgi:hypothetical protein
MTSRCKALALLALTPVVVLALAGCGGDDKKAEDKKSSAPDRSSFVPITTQGVAEIVDRHLGDRVQKYYVFDKSGDDDTAERYVGVRLRGADRRDVFIVSVYSEPATAEESGPCPGDAEQDDPAAREVCFPTSSGGNVTITEFNSGFADDNAKGHYAEADSTGPKDRKVGASYESYNPKIPISDKELSSLLGDPYLGWKTSAKVNQAGKGIKISVEE